MKNNILLAALTMAVTGISAVTELKELQVWNKTKGDVVVSVTVQDVATKEKTVEHRSLRGSMGRAAFDRAEFKIPTSSRIIALKAKGLRAETNIGTKKGVRDLLMLPALDITGSGYGESRHTEKSAFGFGGLRDALELSVVPHEEGALTLAAKEAATKVRDVASDVATATQDAFADAKTKVDKFFNKRNVSAA